MLAGIGGLTLAGCLDLGGETRIGRIAINNFTQSPVSVTVAVLADGSPAYEETHDFEANDPDSVVVPSASITDELPDEPGRYVVRYGRADGEAEQFDFWEEGDTDCGQLLVDVREERIELFLSRNCDTLESNTPD